MKVVFILALVLSSVVSNAQTWEEWFDQKKTQHKYLLQQIAALKVHLQHVKKGYDIAHNGLTAIQGIKNGDLKLHSDYFISLVTVNPAVRNYVKVAGIIDYQLQIIKQAKQTLSKAKETGLFTHSEMDYSKSVFDYLFEETLENLEALMKVIASGSLEMKDDERIKRIDALYTDMLDKYAFCSSFSEEMVLLAVQRGSERNDIKLSKILNALK